MNFEEAKQKWEEFTKARRPGGKSVKRTLASRVVAWLVQGATAQRLKPKPRRKPKAPPGVPWSGRKAKCKEFLRHQWFRFEAGEKRPSLTCNRCGATRKEPFARTVPPDVAPGHPEKKGEQRI